MQVQVRVQVPPPSPAAQAISGAVAVSGAQVQGLHAPCWHQHLRLAAPCMDRTEAGSCVWRLLIGCRIRLVATDLCVCAQVVVSPPPPPPQVCCVICRTDDRYPKSLLPLVHAQQPGGQCAVCAKCLVRHCCLCTAGGAGAAAGHQEAAGAGGACCQEAAGPGAAGRQEAAGADQQITGPKGGSIRGGPLSSVLHSGVSYSTPGGTVPLCTAPEMLAILLPGLCASSVP